MANLRNLDGLSDEIALEVSRLRALRGYSREDDERELIRIAKEFSPAMHILHGVINEILNDFDKAPQPSDLKRILLLRRPAAPRTRCEDCQGTGFVVSRYLISREIDPGTGHLTKTVEMVTKEQAKDLEKRGITWDTFQKQYLADGAEKCSHQNRI